mgnify:CR=1 FL=1
MRNDAAQGAIALHKAKANYPGAQMYRPKGDVYIYGFERRPDGSIEDFVIHPDGRRLNASKQNEKVRSALVEQRKRFYPRTASPNYDESPLDPYGESDAPNYAESPLDRDLGESPLDPRGESVDQYGESANPDPYGESPLDPYGESDAPNYAESPRDPDFSSSPVEEEGGRLAKRRPFRRRYGAGPKI